MNEITVDPQEVVVWLAFSGGWKKASGFVVTIQGVKFSFIPYNNAIVKGVVDGVRNALADSFQGFADALRTGGREE